MLDVPSKRAGLAPSLDLGTMLATAEICKEEISKRLPAFDAAHVYLREIFV